jgi:TPR repeat protein
MHDAGTNDVKKDAARGAELYGKACDAGSARACGNLGSMVERGEGAPKDDASAASGTGR